MPKFYYPSDLQIGQEFSLEDRGDVRHLTRVRRLSPGDLVSFVDRAERSFVSRYLGPIEVEGVRKGLSFLVLEELANSDQRKLELSLFQALPKGSKFDLALELAGSFGANKVYPMSTGRTVKEVQAERLAKQMARWQKILQAQAKQTGRPDIPGLGQPLSLEEAIILTKDWPYRIVGDFTPDTIDFQTYVNDQVWPGLLETSEQDLGRPNIAVFIGPEGGFSPAEQRAFKQAGVQAVSFGPRVLRSELAATFVLAGLTYEGLI